MRRNRGSEVSAPRGARSGLSASARAAIARTRASRINIDALIAGVTLSGDDIELGPVRKKTRPGKFER